MRRARRSLDDFQQRKAEEIYAHLRERRADLEAQAQRKERLRAETRAAAKVPPQFAWFCCCRPCVTSKLGCTHWQSGSMFGPEFGKSVVYMLQFVQTMGCAAGLLCSCVLVAHGRGSMKQGELPHMPAFLCFWAHMRSRAQHPGCASTVHRQYMLLNPLLVWRACRPRRRRCCGGR